MECPTERKHMYTSSTQDSVPSTNAFQKSRKIKILFSVQQNLCGFIATRYLLQEMLKANLRAEEVIHSFIYTDRKEGRRQHYTRFQDIQQDSNNENSQIPVQKQTCRAIQQNRNPGNQWIHLQSTNL